MYFTRGRRHTICSREWSSDVCFSDLSFPFPVYIPWKFGPGFGGRRKPAPGPEFPCLRSCKTGQWERLWTAGGIIGERSEEHTSELQSRLHLVCRLLLEKKKMCRCRLFMRQLSS